MAKRKRKGLRGTPEQHMARAHELADEASTRLAEVSAQWGSSSCDVKFQRLRMAAKYVHGSTEALSSARYGSEKVARATRRYDKLIHDFQSECVCSKGQRR